MKFLMDMKLCRLDYLLEHLFPYPNQFLYQNQFLCRLFQEHLHLKPVLLANQMIDLYGYRLAAFNCELLVGEISVL